MGYEGDESNSSCLTIRDKGAIDMSIDRFILKKLDTCHEERTRINLLKLFKLRIQKAEKAESRYPRIG